MIASTERVRRSSDAAATVAVAAAAAAPAGGRAPAGRRAMATAGGVLAVHAHHRLHRAADLLHANRRRGGGRGAAEGAEGCAAEVHDGLLGAEEVLLVPHHAGARRASVRWP